jgi:hypothetical protein
MMLSPGASSGDAAELFERRRTAAVVALARQRSTSSISSALEGRVHGHDRLDAASLVSGDSAVSVKRLTPTTICSPDSMRATRSAWLATRRLFSSSMAAKAPPSARTSSSSSWRASA